MSYITVGRLAWRAGEGGVGKRSAAAALAALNRAAAGGAGPAGQAKHGRRGHRKFSTSIRSTVCESTWEYRITLPSADTLMPEEGGFASAAICLVRPVENS